MQAREVGFKFLNSTKKMRVNNADALRLVETYLCKNGESAFYVFTTETGFVIVSANDCATPILGYSYEGPFDSNNIPIQLKDYLNDFLKQIEYGMENHLKADDIIAAQWERVRTSGRINSGRFNQEILPLLKAKWGQGCYYNRFCPEDTTALSCGHAKTGCVATAMAQIMHYWKYPETGRGSHSYTPYSHPEYGVQAVDFSSTTYDWDNMPNWLNSSSSVTEIDAVATLMWHCGVSVNMNYGPNQSSGGLNTYQLTHYFKYSDDMIKKNKEDNASWLASLKESLDLRRPVYYSGGNHAFVCDGYDENDLLHFNFGWGGWCDGYYALGALNVSGLNFDTNNAAIFNIHVPANPNLTCQITVSANSTEAGMVLGGGTLQYGDICTLTAQASENCSFLAWLENGTVVSTDSVYSFLVIEDRDIVACFDGVWSAQVEVSLVEDTIQLIQSAVVSWTSGSPSSGNLNDTWRLLSNFTPVTGMRGVATDGRYIYTTDYANYQDIDSVAFYKYDFSGKLMESFNVDGCGKMKDLAYDGKFFYGSGVGGDGKLYCVDLANKTLKGVISTPYNSMNVCAYDPDHDGFWVNDYSSHLKLIDRNGQVIKQGSVLRNCMGLAYYKNYQGLPHLFAFCFDEGWNGAKVYDYDINANVLDPNMLYDLEIDFPSALGGAALGAFVGEYFGKTAFFGCVLNPSVSPDNSYVVIYEIPIEVSQFRCHRIYRVNGMIGESNPELVANRYFGSSYIDQTWDALPNGVYTYGISLIQGDKESEISWSTPVIKDDVKVNAYPHPENGGIVIGKGIYHIGDTVTLKVIPNINYKFVKWIENGVSLSYDTVYSFIAMTNRTIYADLLYNYAVDEQIGERVSLHPNPAKDRVRIECEGMQQMELCTLEGCVVISYQPLNDVQELDLSEFAKGLYILRISLNDGYVITRKLIKE